MSEPTYVYLKCPSCEKLLQGQFNFQVTDMKISYIPTLIDVKESEQAQEIVDAVVIENE